MVSKIAVISFWYSPGGDIKVISSPEGDIEKTTARSNIYKLIYIYVVFVVNCIGSWKKLRIQN